MLAKLWFNQIISGKKKLSEVPPELYEEVKKLLLDSGNYMYIIN